MDSACNSAFLFQVYQNTVRWLLRPLFEVLPNPTFFLRFSNEITYGIKHENLESSSYRLIEMKAEGKKLGKVKIFRWQKKLSL
jgi:hypothetical protein